MGFPNTLLVIVLGALALGSAVFLLRPHEPRYNGHPLSYWVELYGRNPKISPEDRQALASLRLDTLAIPYLLQWIKTSKVAHPTTAPRNSLEWLKGKLKWLNFKSGNLVGWEDRDPEVEARGAALALVALGPQAAAAVPELERLLMGSPDHAMRRHAAFALGHLGAMGFPVLAAALTNADRVVRGSAAFHLGFQSTNAHLAIPLLLERLEDPCPTVFMKAFDSLQRLNAAPHLIVAKLIHRLRDSNVDAIRRGAAIRLKSEFLRKAAYSAVPALQAALSDPFVRRHAAEALRAIAPETLTNMVPTGVKN